MVNIYRLILKYLIPLFLPVLFVISCSSAPEIKPYVPDIEPEWVINEPKSDDYYWVGIGIIEKPLPDDYRWRAQQRALNEIASHIKVHVTGSATDIFQELNYNVDEYFEATIKTRVDQNINDVEYVDHYESKSEFKAYARLSKKKYFAELARKREKAVSTSLELIAKSEPFNVNSFNYMSSALLEIRPYLDQDLDVNIPESSQKKVNLATYIKIKLFDYIDRIEFIPETDPYILKIHSEDGSFYKANCIDKKTSKVLAQIPVLYQVNDQGELLPGISNTDGVLSLNPFLDGKISNPEHISHSLDLSKLVDTSIISILAPMVRNTKVTFNIKGPDFAMRSDEKNLGKKLDPPFISSAIKEYFVVNLSGKFTTENNADYIITLTVNTVPRSEELDAYGFYYVYANAELSIMSSIDNKQLYSKSITQVKGGHVDLKLAGNKALDKLLNEIKLELPKIVEQL